jgi:uncharacterized membrane protein (UPF0127 family)
VQRAPKLILNLTRESVVCEHAVIANTPLRRMRGLLGRHSLPAGEGLLLQPASSIHTGFMHFAIDAVFLDREWRVVKLAEALAPWHAAGARHARYVLELPQGAAQARGIEPGDQLLVVDTDDPPGVDTDGSPAVETDGSRTVDTDAHFAAASAASAGASDLSALRVLIVSVDRRFRAVTAALLSRRGAIVTLAERIEDPSDLPSGQCPEVVVVDAGDSLVAAALTAAAIERVDPTIGIVVVGDRNGAARRLPANPVLTKWGSFNGLYAAIERAHNTTNGSRSDASN